MRFGRAQLGFRSAHGILCDLEVAVSDCAGFEKTLGSLDLPRSQLDLSLRQLDRGAGRRKSPADPRVLDSRDDLPRLDRLAQLNGDLSHRS